MPVCVYSKLKEGHTIKELQEIVHNSQLLPKSSSYDYEEKWFKPYDKSTYKAKNKNKYY